MIRCYECKKLVWVFQRELFDMHFLCYEKHVQRLIDTVNDDPYSGIVGMEGYRDMYKESLFREIQYVQTHLAKIRYPQLRIKFPEEGQDEQPTSNSIH